MLMFPELGLLSDVWFWPITSIPGLIGTAAIEGKRTTLRFREHARSLGVVQNRRPSQICRLERVVGAAS
jgi:hypothetical protein